MLTLRIALLACALACVARAEIIATPSEYRDGEAVLEGLLVYSSDQVGRRPAILIVHQWKGPGPYEASRARQLAELGYVAFVVDIYGKGVRPATPEAARAQTTIYRQDRPLMRRRAAAALTHVRTLPQVDPAQVAAMGYCFGGGVVLELARSGADLKGAISFHGNLETPLPAAAGQVPARLLVCHGAADQAVPMGDVLKFHEEMTAAKADYQVLIYGGADHAFSDPGAGPRYHQLADQRSWAHLLDFLRELFPAARP
jgi:dienelactone hydrolase